jgi:hypothetical protein
VARKDRGGANIPNGVRSADTVPATCDDLDLDRRRVHDWRKARDAGGEAIVKLARQTALDEGRAPTDSDLCRIISPGRRHRTNYSGKYEWYTPAREQLIGKGSP